LVRSGLIVVALLIAAAGLQATWPRVLSPAGVRPDLLTVISLAVGLQCGPWAGIIVGFAAGLIGGSVGASALGAQVAARAVAGYLGGLVGERLHVDRVLVPAVAAGVFTLAAWALHAALAGAGLAPGGAIGLQAAYNGVLGPLLCAIARPVRLDRLP
jgi:rod shape-determining protein MreD